MPSFFCLSEMRSNAHSSATTVKSILFDQFMYKKSRLLVVLVALITLPLAYVPVRAADGPYHFLKEIPIGGEGGWDYLSIDDSGRRLYVTHGNKVVVVDLDKEAVVGEVADTPGVHGFALAPELQRG